MGFQSNGATPNEKRQWAKSHHPQEGQSNTNSQTKRFRARVTSCSSSSSEQQAIGNATNIPSPSALDQAKEQLTDHENLNCLKIERDTWRERAVRLEAEVVALRQQLVAVQQLHELMQRVIHPKNK